MWRVRKERNRMARKCIVLYGHSGGGKTYERMTNPELQKLPYVDLFDVVLDMKKIQQNTFGSMMSEFGRRIKCIAADTIVLEGHFFPGSPSRAWLREWAVVNGYTLEWRKMGTNIRIHFNRLMHDIRSGKLGAGGRMQQFKRDLRRYGI